MKKIKTHTKGDLGANNMYVPKPHSDSDPQGNNHIHYELSPFRKQPDTHGTFDVPTKHKIDRKQKQEMDRSLDGK